MYNFDKFLLGGEIEFNEVLLVDFEVVKRLKGMEHDSYIMIGNRPSVLVW